MRQYRLKRWQELKRGAREEIWFGLERTRSGRAIDVLANEEPLKKTLDRKRDVKQ